MAFAAAGALAQSQPLTFQISLSNPGARSVALGGAFVALADDATAAFANPAGLDQLSRPELSAELRLDISTEPTTDDGADLTGLGFVSFVYPADGWSLAAYGNRLATVTTFEVETYGVSGGYRVSDAVSVGLGISYFDGSLVDQSSTDWGIIAGLLWRITPLWRAGAFYRQGAELEFDVGLPSIFPVNLPDTAGLGVAFRTSGGKITAAFEWDRVGYSTLLESLPTEDLVLDDGDELHFGGEYAFLGIRPAVALRFGLWRDPDHRIRGPGERGAGAEIHQTLGLGLVFRHLQLDLGADFADLESTLSVSIVYWF